MFVATRRPLQRLLLLDARIRAGRYPDARRLAADLEVNLRTIQRDLQFLRNDLQAPLHYDSARKGYCYTNLNWQLPYFRLTEGEMMALFIAERALRQYRGTPYEADLQQAFAKLAALLPEEVTLNLSALAESHSFRTSACTLADLETFRRLVAAVLHSRQLRLSYWTASRDDLTDRVIDPYHLANIDGDWYLVAHCHLRGGIRTFSPARIRSLTETGGTFQRPPDFSISSYLKGSFRVVREDGQPLVQVRLRFAPSAARYIREKVWHPSQRLRETEAGLELTMSLTSLIEIRRWVLSFGDECEVLSPAKLRHEVQNQLARAARQYEKPGKRLAPSARRQPAANQRTG